MLMTNPTQMQVQTAVEALLESDETQLYEQLGIRVTAMTQEPALAGDYSPDLRSEELAMGPLEDLRKLGQRIYGRWEKETYSMVCGQSTEDAADRKSIVDAFGIGGTAVAAYLATALVSTFGLAPAIAAVIAALVVRRFFRPAYQEFCGAWSERLSAGTPSR